MSIATTESRSKAGWRPRRWTTAEFDALVADGHLREGSKAFLWDGEIIEPMPENEPHVNAQDNLQRSLASRLPEAEWTIRPAHPLALRDGFKPQPDLVVLSGPRSGYRSRVPGAADAALVVEIADSTYAEDAGDKLPEYALAGIPKFWIVHIRARRIETYSDPVVSSGVGGYATRQDFVIGQAVPLVLVRGATRREFAAVDVLDVLRDSMEDE
jgi:hypothetical protein